MLLFTVHLECDITTSKKEIRDYKNGDYDKIRSILKDMDWESFMTGTTNESWIQFRDLLHSLTAEQIAVY